jgi:hypothetical protein
MASINLTHKTFLDFIALFLFGQISGLTEDDENPRFVELVDELSKKGILPVLHKYKIYTDSETKQKYKTFERSFLKNEIENIYIRKDRE